MLPLRAATSDLGDKGLSIPEISELSFSIPSVSFPTQPSLPAELLHSIISLCDKPSLLALCTSSAALREIASPLLYSTPILRSPAQLDVFTEPVRPSFQF
jgi:hypothetical protein